MDSLVLGVSVVWRRFGGRFAVAPIRRIRESCSAMALGPGNLAAVARRSTFVNLARNALRPSYLPVMLRKIKARLRPPNKDEALAWASEHAESVETFGESLDPELWAEANQWADGFEPQAQSILSTIGVPLGGGGHHRLLYFLTRLTSPETVLETGVAAGWSSAAVLSALAANGSGTLWSSDFPYFRLDNPERYVGCVVPEALRDGWNLYLKGDRSNLAEILPQCGAISLFHYDSDKSYDGRTFAMDAVASHLTPECVIICDDIDDNTWFRDWVLNRGGAYRVFERGGKYVGLVGL